MKRVRKKLTPLPCPKSILTAATPPRYSCGHRNTHCMVTQWQKINVKCSTVHLRATQMVAECSLSEIKSIQSLKFIGIYGSTSQLLREGSNIIFDA